MPSNVLAILLSWASYLSGYPIPDQPPELQFRTHEWLVVMACLGKECNVVGWYEDNGIIYIDEKYKQSDGFGDSIVVHEMVHYLQDISGKFSGSCADTIAREREAYLVQSQYLMQATGSIRPVGPLRIGCRDE